MGEAWRRGLGWEEIDGNWHYFTLVLILNLQNRGKTGPRMGFLGVCTGFVWEEIGRNGRPGSKKREIEGGPEVRAEPYRDLIWGDQIPPFKTGNNLSI